MYPKLDSFKELKNNSYANNCGLTISYTCIINIETFPTLRWNLKINWKAHYQLCTTDASEVNSDYSFDIVILILSCIFSDLKQFQAVILPRVLQSLASKILKWLCSKGISLVKIIDKENEGLYLIKWNNEHLKLQNHYTFCVTRIGAKLYDKEGGGEFEWLAKREIFTYNICNVWLYKKVIDCRSRCTILVPVQIHLAIKVNTRIFKTMASPREWYAFKKLLIFLSYLSFY